MVHALRFLLHDLLGTRVEIDRLFLWLLLQGCRKYLLPRGFLHFGLDSHRFHFSLAWRLPFGLRSFLGMSRLDLAHELLVALFALPNFLDSRLKLVLGNFFHELLLVDCIDDPIAQQSAISNLPVLREDPAAIDQQ